MDDEVGSWKQAGVDVVVSALTGEEMTELDIEQEPEMCRTHGIEYVSVPIPDRGLPPSLKDIADVVRRMESSLSGGKNVAVHCRMGVGRSALLAAAVLVGAGVPADRAFERIAAARGCPVPDTAEQRAWVARFAAQLPALRDDAPVAAQLG